MRTLVVLRHSLTRKRERGPTASHLSPEGVRLAREVGLTLPPMAHVAVGDQPRHLETALSLGCAVDEQVSWASGYVPGEVDHHDQWRWSEPFVRYAELLAAGGGLSAMADEHLDHWHRILGLVPEGGCALVVSSGGSIEPVLVAALPDEDHRAWGDALHHLDGATLTHDGDRFTSLRFLRGSDQVGVGASG